MKELRDLITDYLRQAKLMQLATVVNDKLGCAMSGLLLTETLTSIGFLPQQEGTRTS